MMPVLEQFRPLLAHVGEGVDHRGRDVGRCRPLSVVELRVLLLLLLRVVVLLLLLLLLRLLLLFVGEL